MMVIGSPAWRLWLLVLSAMRATYNLKSLRALRERYCRRQRLA